MSGKTRNEKIHFVAIETEREPCILPRDSIKGKYYHVNT